MNIFGGSGELVKEAATTTRLGLRESSKVILSAFLDRFEWRQRGTLRQSPSLPPEGEKCRIPFLTEKILKEAYAQQKEVKDEENAPMSSFSFKQPLYELEDVIDDDVDVDEIQSQLDYHEDMEKEEKLLLDAFFNKDGDSIAKRLSDAITSSLEAKQHIAATGSACVSETDYYQKLGDFMSLYTHGKMPKALNHLTRLENWESLLKLTQPESWSPNAMYKATNMFASSTEAERFYELFLLPRVREDIRIHKKLHFCLYQSLKRSLFKPKGLYCGILLPLCKSGTCTIPEAVIIGSIIHKFSIPKNFSSAALVCLAEMEFLGTRSYFMKAILEKKYALAHLAIDAVAAHFLRFRKQTKVMPVIWHQTLLAFVQRYKHELRKEDKKSLTSLLEKQNHELITPEIVRELISSRNPSATSIIHIQLQRSTTSRSKKTGLTCHKFQWKKTTDLSIFISGLPIVGSCVSIFSEPSFVLCLNSYLCLGDCH
ncbi:hypothetical protein HID58_075001 [Brassica napus]|uniref:Bystin n=1 Tax=Brassica napus TaxID=3708 RepID=A0ABQ7YID1_BRANA|nr:hypothetical protein HID58_075001 [Brassica napus]